MTRGGLRGSDKRQSDLRDAGQDTPEGLKRPRKGPVDKDVGRAYEDAAKQLSKPLVARFKKVRSPD